MSKTVPHVYEYDVQLEGNSAPARIIRMVGDNMKVLEVGAGPGSITKHLINSRGCKVTAIEIDEEAIEKLSQITSDVCRADLNDRSWPQMLESHLPFEVIVAGDVLEHLYNPWETLLLMKEMITKDGCIVVSLPHVGHSAIAACLLDEDFKYRDWGLLDRTHIRFFGLKNIQQLFEGAGLKIVEAQFVIMPPEETEFADKWDGLPEHVKSVLSQHRYGQVYQVVVKAIPQEREGCKLDLMSVPVHDFDDAVAAEVKVGLTRKLARKYLSKNTRRRILRFVRS